MIIHTKNADEVSDLVNAFYVATGRPTKKVDPSDKIVMAISEEKIVGVVRLCFEQGYYVLRTMQVHPNFQRKGIGLEILQEFERTLEKLGIHESYCFAFAHLEKFYGSIGYIKINNSEAPQFLQERLMESSRQYPDKAFINMVRSTVPGHSK
jgi:N-acetylglutamate synthase-like GNAT family acetyltransferase